VILGSRTFAPFLVFALSIGCFGQSSSKHAPSSGPSTKRFCQAAGGFCFTYPASWSVLGEAFGNGVVVAPHQTTEQSLWNVVTAAMVADSPEEGGTATSIDGVIATALSNMRAAGHEPVTLQRQERTLAGLPAQIIKVRYHDDGTARDWVEQLVFIEGIDQEIYSLSLKAQPPDIARLEPAFNSILRSWHLQTGEDASGRYLGPATSPSKPTQSHP
jgi:hypothetical protein